MIDNLIITKASDGCRKPNGGSNQIRTGVNGFADRYLTTRTWNHIFCSRDFESLLDLLSPSLLRCKVSYNF